MECLFLKGVFAIKRSVSYESECSLLKGVSLLMDVFIFNGCVHY